MNIHYKLEKIIIKKYDLNTFYLSIVFLVSPQNLYVKFSYELLLKSIIKNRKKLLYLDNKLIKNISIKF